MNNITDRQQDLLLSIIKEFIETAEAVGSISLQSKYNLNVSTATIRNEMADLVLLGYLYQKSLSGGRIPTTKGWRYFVDNILSDSSSLESLSQDTKENINERLVKSSYTKGDLIRASINLLSQITGTAAVSLIDKDLYYSGLSELVNIPEFRNPNNLKRILSILEDYYTLSKIMNEGNPDEDINILIGEETNTEEFSEYSIIFAEIRVAGDKKGYIAVIGPNRLKYNTVISAMKYISAALRNLLKDNY